MLNTNWHRGRPGGGGGGGAGSFAFMGGGTGALGLPLGEPAPDRRIFVITAWGKSRFGQNGCCLSLAVNGIPATFVEGSPIGVNYEDGVQLWVAEVPEGETGDITQTFQGGGWTAVWRIIYRASGLASFTPGYSFYHRSNPTTVTMPASGFGIVAGCNRGTFTAPLMDGTPTDPVMDYGLHVSGSGGSGTTFQCGHYEGVPAGNYDVGMTAESAIALAWNL